MRIFLGQTFDLQNFACINFVCIIENNYYGNVPYSGLCLRGPNFCEICEWLIDSQIFLLKWSGSYNLVRHVSILNGNIKMRRYRYQTVIFNT